MVKRMKVSIIIPVYNVEKYIEKCLNSLVNQTLKDIEIIIINDGSSDKSEEIIKRYLKEYSDIIKYYKTKNGGQGAARNYGLKKARGKYIMFVDADDFIESTMAESLYNKAIKEDSDIVICGDNIISEKDYNIIKKESCYSYSKKEDTLNFIFGNMAVWNKIYKKDIIAKNNIKFREHVWYEDLDFTYKIFLHSSKVSYVDKFLYNYLLREGSTMNNQNIERNLELCKSFDEIIQYCESKNLYDDNYEKIEFLCLYHIYICGIVRVIRTKCSNKNKRKIINELKSYTKNHFTNIKKNQYIKYLDNNKKIIYFLIKYKQYKIIAILFKIRGLI